MRNERNYLTTNAFPILKSFCAEHNLDFKVCNSKEICILHLYEFGYIRLNLVIKFMNLFYTKTSRINLFSFITGNNTTQCEKNNIIRK